MTTQEIQDEIIREFKPFRNLLDKYSYLVKLGKSLPPLSPEFKNEDTLIRGCQLTTWFSYIYKDEKIYFKVDSSSLLIKGAIVLLLRVLSEQKPEDIIATDLYFIDKAGLSEIFAPIRANSLWKLGNLMRESADKQLSNTNNN